MQLLLRRALFRRHPMEDVKHVAEERPRRANNRPAAPVSLKLADQLALTRDSVSLFLNVPFGQRDGAAGGFRSEEHTSELQSPVHLVCRLLLEKKKNCSITHELYTE